MHNEGAMDEDTRTGPVDVEIFFADDSENRGVNSGNDGGVDEDTRAGPVEIFFADDSENRGVDEDTRTGPVEIFFADDSENRGVEEDTRTGPVDVEIFFVCFFDFDFIGSSSRFFLFFGERMFEEGLQLEMSL